MSLAKYSYVNLLFVRNHQNCNHFTDWYRKCRKPINTDIYVLILSVFNDYSLLVH